MKAVHMLQLALGFIMSLATSAKACSQDAERKMIYDPLPATAQGLPISNTTGYAIDSIGQGLYMVTDGGYQAMFAVSTEGVILVDAPVSMQHLIAPAIGNITTQPITHLVYSHYHKDHIAAASALVTPATEIIAHALTKSLLQAVDHPTRPLPTTTFSTNYTLSVGNQTLELAYYGDNHTPGNIFIHAPAQKTLMVVDIVMPGWVPFDQLAFATDVPGYLRAQSQILAYDFDTFIGGHINRLGDRKDILESFTYVQDLFDNCNATLRLPAEDPNSQVNLYAGSISRNPRNIYAASRAIYDVPAKICGNKTLEKWKGRLGGADVFAFENAFAVVVSLAIDFD